MGCGNESSMERKFLGAKVLSFLGAKVRGNESSIIPVITSVREQKFQGTKVPEDKTSTNGTFVPGNEISLV